MSSLWHQYGLRRNPFFQEPLGDDGDVPDLTSFFIGRDVDRAASLTQLTHDEQTRVVLLGAPGVGKTTLMNRLLADVRLPVGMRPAWLVASIPPINLPSAATLQDFCIEVLRHVLDMRRQIQDAAAHGPRGGRAKVAKTAERVRRTLVAGNPIWDTVARMIEGALTLSPQAFGMGVSTQFTAPHMGAATWLPLTREAIAALAREADRDVVIAVNNAENLREDVAERATSVLAEARDLFLTPHTHWLFVGTPDFFDSVIKPRRQLAGVMGCPVRLPPMDARTVQELIARRYDALRVAGTTFVEPIKPSDAGALAHVYAGDLRELLRALEVAIVRLAPLGARTLPLGDAMKVVAQQQAERFRDRMEGAGWAHLTRVVLAFAAQGIVIQRFREVDAVRLLAPMRQPTVHNHKRGWIEAGLIRADGRTGAAEWFTVTGETLLAMLPAALARGLTTDALLNGRDLEREGMPVSTPEKKSAGGRSPKKR